MNRTLCPFEIEASWKRVLEEELHESYLIKLAAFLEQERVGLVPVYPSRELVFNAFYQAPYDGVKVVIMGQDPYHGPGQAHGLSFSVPKGVTKPPSLKNIFKELASDMGFSIPDHGCLVPWARQGVLLLNATLTVRQGEPKSHYGKGWERFTDRVIAKLAEREDPVVFALWGNSAKEKVAQIPQVEKADKHYILTAAHPSPYSATSGFFGCRHFSKINDILLSLSKKPIDWSLK